MGWRSHAEESSEPKLYKMTRVKLSIKHRVCQGDIYRDIAFIEYAVERKGVIEFSQIVFPLVVVLTQDCDLEQDYRVRWSRRKATNHDKKLFSVIVAPLYNAEHVYKGEHLSELSMTMASINKSKTPGEFLRKNEIPRYHFLAFPEGIPIVASIIDFKHYFTVNVEYLKRNQKSKFVCRLGPLYREDLSQRFSGFLSRIGLPD